MFVLPTEVQLDLTNFYFYNLINKYEGELARMKFFNLSIIDENKQIYFKYKLIEPKSVVFEFTLNDQLMQKWQTSIDKSIPLFLSNYEFNFFINIERTTYLVDRNPFYLLKLPTVPKNIEEMIMVRCWLEQLSNCAFEYAYFYNTVFNPEMINILFDNDKTIPFQFNIKSACLLAYNDIFENVLKFASNHLSICKSLTFDFRSVDFTEKYTNILFNMLINEGNKIPKIKFTSYKLARLHDLITEYIATTKDCSKIVPDILFYFSNSPPFKLSERAENVEIKQVDDVKYTKYQISNIYNTKVKFEFCNEEDSDEWTFCNKVKIMKKN
uniref:Uncharacterized protein n=1 Tax=Meloidogyne enterolobii TaxID=390850 RepID=A0A6V7TQK3_MELEN|nr:unnamed protein product [Meloidogyne enterolobii]